METMDHILPVTSRVDERGNYEVGGSNVSALARTWGTPLYLYDGKTIQTQIHSLTGLLSEYGGGFEITYAGKAYLSLGMAKKLAGLGIGVDVVSLGELEIAKRAGFSPDRVHLHGNNKSEPEIEAALLWGVHCIVADSLSELELIEATAARLGKIANIWMRINPDIEVDSHPYLQTGKHASKFGFEIETGAAATGIRMALKSQRLRLIGLHCHLGSQITQEGPYERAVHVLLDLAAANGFIPQEVSPGGGWGVPYTPDGILPDPAKWVLTITNAMKRECEQRGWALPRLVMEPGRWLVARSGLAVYTIGSIKQVSDGRCLVAVDGGMADNPRPPLYHARYTAFRADCPQAQADVRSAIVGKYCESGDELIPEVMLPEVERGDILVIPAAGAYQLSMSSNYNLAGRPAVLWLENGEAQVLQEREKPWENGWWVSG
jgi:diaminopimelate decarboxylase